MTLSQSPPPKGGGYLSWEAIARASLCNPHCQLPPPKGGGLKVHEVNYPHLKEGESWRNLINSNFFKTSGSSIVNYPHLKEGAISENRVNYPHLKEGACEVTYKGN